MHVHTSAGTENKSTLGKIKSKKWGDNKIEEKVENFHVNVCCLFRCGFVALKTLHNFKAPEKNLNMKILFKTTS